MPEPLTTEELIFRVDGLAKCAAHMIRTGEGEPFPPAGLNTLMETLCEAAGELGGRADALMMTPTGQKS
jgi:hypothetical protein